MSRDSELIAAAIAAGKVRRIPRGVSGINPFTREPAPEGFTFGLQLIAPRSVYPEIDATDAMIKKLWRQDATYRDIGAMLELPFWKVRTKLYRLGLKGLRTGRRKAA